MNSSSLTVVTVASAVLENNRFESSKNMMNCLKSLRKAARAVAMPVLACAAAVLLTSCATESAWDDSAITLEQDGPARLKQLVEMQDRLEDVSGKLLIRNTDLCQNQLRNILGFSVANKYTYSSAWASMAESTLGLGNRLQVMNVVPGSGAERAGLKRGDVLVSIDGTAAPQGSNAEQEAVQMLSSAVSQGRAVAVTVSRGGSQRTLTIPVTVACGFHVELGQSPNVTAFSDGNRIMITQGMMIYAKSDESLAYVIAKEMAHTVLDHPKLVKNTAKAKILIDKLIQTPAKSTDTTGLRPMSRKFDIDSDSLSLAMLMRGGYGIDGTTRFWRNLAYHYPATRKKHYTSLHPETTSRVSVMPQSITRIKAIERRRKALPSTR